LVTIFFKSMWIASLASEILEAKNLARVVTCIDKSAKEQGMTLDMALSLHP